MWRPLRPHSSGYRNRKDAHIDWDCRTYDTERNVPVVAYRLTKRDKQFICCA